MDTVQTPSKGWPGAGQRLRSVRHDPRVHACYSLEDEPVTAWAFHCGTNSPACGALGWTELP